MSCRSPRPRWASRRSEDGGRRGKRSPTSLPGRHGPSARRLPAASFLVWALILSCLPAAAAASKLYSVPRTGDLLRIINPATGATLESLQINLPGETISGCNGLAQHPHTKELHALVRTDSGFPPNRQLVRISRITGAATLIGDTGERFAGLAFDAGGTLYAVTGDGGATSETLYTLSLTDGTSTFVMSLGNGGDGEAISFNPADGFLYHASGHNDGSTDTRILEKIDLNLLTTTNIPISGTAYGEIAAMTSAGTGLIASDTIGPALRATLGGAFTAIGTMDHVPKGFAFEIPALGGWWRVALTVSLAMTLLAVVSRRLRRT